MERENLEFLGYFVKGGRIQDPSTMFMLTCFMPVCWSIGLFKTSFMSPYIDTTQQHSMPRAKSAAKGTIPVNGDMLVLQDIDAVMISASWDDDPNISQPCMNWVIHFPVSPKEVLGHGFPATVETVTVFQ